MDYKYIENNKLRRLMQKARHKRKVLDNPNRLPPHEQSKIQQKYKKSTIRDGGSSALWAAYC